jgi:hypothetical protein
MSDFLLDVTLSAVWGELDDGSLFKKHQTEHISTVDKSIYAQGSEQAQHLVELLEGLLEPFHQSVQLVDSRPLHSLKINHNYSYIYLAETFENPDSHECYERYARGTVKGALLPVEDWIDYITYYPEVKVNNWYFQPETNEAGWLYLSRKQLAMLLLRSRVTLHDLILNDSSGSLGYTLAVGLRAPATIRWQNLSPESKSNLTSLPECFLKELYREVICKRREHIKNDRYPVGLDTAYRCTKTNLSMRVRHLKPLLNNKYNSKQLQDIAGIYYAMLSSNSGPDLFILDVACESVLKKRLLTNDELLQLAETSIAVDRNKKISGYSHDEFFNSGTSELKKGTIKWKKNSSVQGLARRYREVAISRLLKNHFSVHKKKSKA